MTPCSCLIAYDMIFFAFYSQTPLLPYNAIDVTFADVTFAVFWQIRGHERSPLISGNLVRSVPLL